MKRRAFASAVLAASISGTPYLDRHADDAVRWRSWSDATLGEARSTNRLLLVSVGFFACHGCHVMEKESFENPDVARTLNELTVPVLVDRDDRPDLDARFAADLRRVGVEVGWPMTLWLLPDGRAVSVATYLDAQALVERTRRLADLWAREPARLVAVATATPLETEVAPESPARGPLESFQALTAAAEREFDSQHGGLRGAPKFPRDLPVQALFVADRSGIAGAGLKAEATLRAILASPLHDRIDGGFHRYATDEAWQSPHWEKLLDENALLALDLFAAWRATGAEDFRVGSRSTLDFIRTRLTLPAGGFAQALDSEAAYYRLSAAERREARPPARDESAIVAANAHAARAFARAGFWFDGPESSSRFLEIGRATVDTLLSWRLDGRLAHARRSGVASPGGTLADHAALGLAALEVFTASGTARHLEAARSLDAEIARHFTRADGSLVEFESGARPADEALPDRPVPSGAALALELAARLQLLDKPLDTTRSDRARRAFAHLEAASAREPLAHADSLLATSIVDRPVEIVIAVRQRRDAQPWIDVAARHAPWRALLLVVDDSTRRSFEGVTSLVAGKTPQAGRARAFVCKGAVCDRPAEDLATFQAQLDALR